MGAPPVPRPPVRERAADVLSDSAFDAFVRAAAERGVPSGGQHHQNYVAPLVEPVARLVGRAAGTPVVVRIPRAAALPVVIRTWQDEAEILGALHGVLPHVPECLVKRENVAIHSYVPGVPLSSLCGNGKPVDGLMLKALVGLLARMSQVRREALPPLPADWPRNGKDGQAFLRTLAHLADRQIRQPNWAAYGGLFAALGVPGDALTRLAGRVPAMARRPYSLLHTDLHRDNVIVPYGGDHGGDPTLICVDWELATYGDPLHDLATHLVRMRYPAFQRDEVIHAWADAMAATRPAAVNGLATDLRHYLAFEQAQSVFPDVMRAARSLTDSLDQESLDAATAEVHRALGTAAEPLGLAQVPGTAEIRRALYRWQASLLRRSPGARRATIGWVPDRRVPEHPEFPHPAVLSALMAEGAAPAGRVFKGTAHLNSVVRVPGVGFPVVVRRRLASVCRREPSHLSEHAVLRAIESSRVAVTAPRVLALGESGQRDPFAIHTYVGPLDGDQPPNHPVHGLLPHEADGLVDQLCALTDVDHGALDPMAGEPDFYTWLSGQLVGLVRGLPRESQQLARQLGLPDAARLGQILARHEVTPRSPSLLHGDLNPWNLVRRPDRFALTIIDWEMAMVGDPLYDLVRHLHLTPTRPEIRERMFRRWERGLARTRTKDWQRDWRVYRWIEIVRSAYVDLDRLVTGAGLDAPNVRRAVSSYAMTLRAATASLGLPLGRLSHPCLARALPDGGQGSTGPAGLPVGR
ncbi:aminoglycoside phosphotransferase family protein [Streptomyces avermitilis]|uniref:aminoglycoside phosphotransferase family protein n=1 Tax=Streptomyces avermitilis TaxID=33903 RepID=UPI0033CE2F42